MDSNIKIGYKLKQDIPFAGLKKGGILRFKERYCKLDPIWKVKSTSKFGLPESILDKIANSVHTEGVVIKMTGSLEKEFCITKEKAIELIKFIDESNQYRCNKGNAPQ